MALCSTIPLGCMEYLRFDADYYKPQYLDEAATWEKISESLGVERLSRLVSVPVRTGRTPSDRRFKKDDKPVVFIKTDGVREGFINFEEAGSLPRRVLSGHDYISPSSLVMTIIGATPEIVGRTAIVRETDPICVTNQNVAVISLSSKCNPYYLVAFFQTHLGRNQIWRHSRRTGQVNLNCREVERARVLLPDMAIQDLVADLVQKSFRCSDDSEILYNEAKRIFDRSVAFDVPAEISSHGSVASISSAVTKSRIDADYFRPRFIAVHNHLDNLNTVRLASIARVRKGIEVGSDAYTDSGIPFIRVSNVTERGFKFGESDKFLSEDSFKSYKDEFSPKTGELLLTKDGSPGICFALDSPIDGIISGGIVRLLPIDMRIPRNYLALAINSTLCRLQIEQECSGALILHWTPTSIKKLRVPVVSEEKMQEISDLVSQSRKAHSDSRRYLEQAKDHIEQLIEKAVAA